MTSNKFQDSRWSSPKPAFDPGKGDVFLDEATLRFTRWLGVLTLGAALLGLAFFGSPSARAEDPPGFKSGGRDFSNPFANQKDYKGKKSDRPRRPSRPRPSSKTAAKSAGGTNNLTKDVPDPTYGDAGIEVGGDPPAGVIPGQKVPFIEIETETGEGSKQIVTDFNFPSAEIIDIAKTMGKLTGKNFIFDKDVKGRISIVSNSPITVGDAWRAFLTALDMNNLTIIGSGKYLRIARQRDARDKQISTYVNRDSPNTDALITRVFALKYIGADEISRVFRSFMPANSRIIPHEPTNTLIVTDTGSNVAKLAQMLEFLDVEGFDAGIEVISIRFASAVDLATLIDTLIPDATSGGGSSRSRSSRGRSSRSRGRSMGSFSARKTKEGGLINNIIADERTNTLIIHANQKGYEQVLALVKKLDRTIPLRTGTGRIHVLYLEHADAEKISETLGNLSQGSGKRKNSKSSGKGGIGVNPTTTSLFEGEIKVAPDVSTNSLVITASPADFETIKSVIKRLDIRRDEVFVEAIIMEMAVKRGLVFSANVATPVGGPFSLGAAPNISELVSYLSSPAGVSGLALGFKAGNTISVPNPTGGEISVGSINGLIQALQNHSSTDILATPQILALDNEEATFESGEKVPVPTQSTGINGIQNQSIRYENIKLSLKIKPRINKASNVVTLEVNAILQDQGNSVPSGLADQAFSVIERSAETIITVQDEDTVVLGGLMRERISKSATKIPILGDIPLLGWLFRSTRDESTKTNLMIFLTPHIIRRVDMARKLLDRKLQERDDFLEKNAGGEDELRDYRDNMIRNLPSVAELKRKETPDSAALLEDDPELIPFPGSVEEAEDY